MVTELVILAAVLAVVLLTVALVYVLPRRRREAPPRQPGVDYEPGVGDDSGPPVDAPKRTVETVDLPEAPSGEARPAETLPGELPPIEPGPVVERPAPAAGRLVRLRSRLARSQSALGQGLLALLSRDRLDEDTWEEIEDTLITADLGVGASHELVERLRARTRVEGVADATDARRMLREELLALVLEA